MEKAVRVSGRWMMQAAAHTPAVSVITPTMLDPERTPLLERLHIDLQASDADWEWLLVVDGPSERTVPWTLAHDPRVHVVPIGRHVGAAAARNLGLGRACGAFVTTVDDDDSLPDGSLSVRLDAALSAGVGWTCGMIADERDGVVQAWAGPMPHGRVPAGSVWRSWGCPCMPFPLGPTTIMADTDLVRRVGGWQGLPQAEDFGMALAVTGATAGVVLDDVVYVYHRHTAQMTVQPEFDDLEPLVRQITFERGRLLAEPYAPPAALSRLEQRLPA